MFWLHYYECVEIKNHFSGSQESFYATEIRGDEVYIVSQGDQGLEEPSPEVQGPISLIRNSVSVVSSYI